MSIIKNSAYNLATRILLLVSSIITSIILAHLLGARGKGIFSAVNLIPGIITVFFGFGIGISLIYYQSKFPKKAQIFFFSSFLFFLFLSPLLVIIAILLYPFFDHNYFKDIPFYYYYLGTFVIMVNFFNQISISRFVSKKQFKEYNLIRIISAMVSIILYILFTYFSTDKIFFAILAGLCGQLTYLILTFYFYKDIIIFFPLKKSIKYFMILFRYGYKAAFTGISNFLNTRADFFLVKYFLNASSFAFYSLSVLLSEIILYLPGSVTVAMFPELNSMKKNDRKDLFIKALKINAIVLFIVSTILYFLAPFIIGYFYGTEFLPAVNSFNYLIIGVFFLGLYKINETYFAANNKVHLNALFAFSMFAINCILNIILIPKYGISGAALSSSIAYFSGFTFSSFILFFNKKHL